MEAVNRGIPSTSSAMFEALKKKHPENYDTSEKREGVVEGRKIQTYGAGDNGVPLENFKINMSNSSYGEKRRVKITEGERGDGGDLIEIDIGSYFTRLVEEMAVMTEAGNYASVVKSMFDCYLTGRLSKYRFKGILPEDKDEIIGVVEEFCEVVRTVIKAE